MEITWYVEDGYCNPGPQSTVIDDEELEGMTIEEKRKYIEQYIQDDFNDKVSWSCDIDKYLEE